MTMKYRTTIFQASILLLLVFFFSCKKFLDEKADKKLVELRTLDDLQALLDDNSRMNANMPGFGETSADDYFILKGKFNTYLDIFKKPYVWELSNYTYLNDWAYSYNSVYNANYCLDYISKIPRIAQNETQWNNVKGSALFFRAFRYLNLIWEHGRAYDSQTSQNDLGIVLRTSSDPSIPSVRSNVKNCYERIIADATEAALYLPDYPQHVMRPSKAAVYGLLARAYLSMRDYDNAYHFADLCLQIKSDLLDYNNTLEVSKGSLTPFRPFNQEIIFFASQSGNYASKNPPDGLIDTVLYNRYEANDLRKAVFFYLNNHYQSFKGNYNAQNMSSFFSGIAVDEVFLIRAECQARAGRISEAMNDLNSLLLKRHIAPYTPITASTPLQALNIILIERRKELIFRGLRWIDIKRLNKEGADIILKRVLERTYTLAPNSDKYALALPIDILNQTNMPQNPGW
jgi:hypothetical protein